MLQDKTPTPALHALLACFRARSSTSGTPTSSYEFFDNVVSRFVKRPVFYEDRIAALAAETMLSGRSPLAGPISPLILAIVEQWPYFVKTESMDVMDKEATAVIVADFLRHCKLIGEDPDLLTLLCGKLAAVSEGCAWEQIFRSALAERHTPLLEATPSHDADITEQSHTDKSPEGPPGTKLEVHEEVKPMLLPSSKFLSKWANKDLQEAIEDGDVSKLILCLCSETISIRLQALASLKSLVNKLGQSSYIEREMVVLLLQETIHTAKDIVHEKPFPTYLGVFASQAVQVEADPQHILYSKLNRFLHEGPVWESDKVPMVRSILHHPPDDNNDDSSISGSNELELSWFLNMVFNGLRTAEVCLFPHSYLSERIQ
jgi:nucleolar pre-ribosomal-associated protein 1